MAGTTSSTGAPSAAWVSIWATAREAAEATSTFEPVERAVDLAVLDRVAGRGLVGVAVDLEPGAAKAAAPTTPTGRSRGPTFALGQANRVRISAAISGTTRIAASGGGGLVHAPQRPRGRPRSSGSDPGLCSLSWVRLRSGDVSDRCSRSSGGAPNWRRWRPRCARREFAAVEVVGEPGIGKTRLLAELEARADAQGCLVLAGSASELEADLPFGVFVDALDEYLYGLEPRRLAGLDDDARGARPRLPRARPAPPAARSATACTAPSARCSRSSASPKPLVLILDDLHWADSGSLELLGSLLRRPPAAPRAARARGPPAPGAGADRRARWSGDRRGSSWARSARPRRASSSATAADEVFADSGGNPFYLEQLARAPRRPRRRRRWRSRGVEVRARSRPRWRASSRSSPATRAGARGRRGRRRSVRARAGRGRGRASASERRADALDELLRGDLVRPRTSRAASASATRSCAARSTRARRAAGGWRARAQRAPRSRARRDGGRARPPRRALRPPRRPRRDRGAARGGRGRRRARRRRPRGCSAPRCGCSGPRAPERADLLGAGRAHMGAGQWHEAYDAIREALDG